MKIHSRQESYVLLTLVSNPAFSNMTAGILGLNEMAVVYA